jgi:membrane protein DedA with SNARE-associated domain
MAVKFVEILKQNVITAFVIVALPLVIALVFLGYMIIKGTMHGWGYGFVALIVAFVVQYPYLKIADKYFFN